MFVDAPSFPIADRAEDMDNATLARRALLDVNAARHAEGMGVARHWYPRAQRDSLSFRECLVGRTVGDRRLAVRVTRGFDDYYYEPGCYSPFVREVECRFEGWYGRRPLSAMEAARATGWQG